MPSLSSPLSRYPFTDDQVVPDCEWEVFLRETASMIITDQSPRRYCMVKKLLKATNLKFFCITIIIL